MSVDREESATRMSVECPLCNHPVGAETTLVDHLRGEHSKRELAAFIDRYHEEVT